MEHGLGRILVFGTTMLAAISGITAVNLPFEYISSFVQPVTSREKQDREDRLMASMEVLRGMEEEIAIAEFMASSSDRGPNPLEVINHEGRAQETGTPQGDRDSFRHRIRRVYSEVFGDKPLEMPETEIASAERHVKKQFLQYNDMAASWHRQQFGRTPIGILFTLFGWCMLMFCVARVVMAVESIVAQRRIVRSEVRKLTTRP